MTLADHLHRVIVKVPSEYADPFATAIEMHVDAVAWTAREGQPIAQITGFSENPPDEKAITDAIAATGDDMDASVPDIEFSLVPVQNWVLENIRQFPPIVAGRFFVHGSEYQEPIPPGRISLCVPAGAAFGTGDHGSTKGCLLALDHLQGKRVRNALDMGCGSGILALAIAKRWKCRVAASDIDVAAGRTTRTNASVNGLRRYLDVYVGPGYRNRSLKKQSYDLIVSNILARPLVRFSRALSLRTPPGGTIILAGLLVAQEAQVISAHRQHGLHLSRRIRIEGWSTLVFQRRC
ncbi:MAG: 50S ribosomal protein L11 methyltransferase [Rhodospirillales bacterium]|nr:50S ribosomal protein L11 methyltransferase [Rhodospirillales bacterium]